MDKKTRKGLYKNLNKLEENIFLTEGIPDWVYDSMHSFNFTDECEIEIGDENYTWVWIDLGDNYYCIGAFNIEHENLQPVEHDYSSFSNPDKGNYDENEDVNIEDDYYDDNYYGGNGNDDDYDWISRLYWTNQDDRDYSQRLDAFYVYWECANSKVDDFSSITGDSWWHKQRYFTNGRLLWLCILKYIRNTYRINSFLVYNQCLSITSSKSAWRYHKRMGMRPFTDNLIQELLYNSQKNGLLQLIRDEHYGSNEDGEDSEYIWEASPENGGFLFYYYDGDEMMGNPNDYNGRHNVYNFYEDFVNLGLGPH